MSSFVSRPAGGRYRLFLKGASEILQSVDETPYEELSREMTLVATTGIEDPLRSGVREALAECHKAGVIIEV